MQQLLQEIARAKRHVLRQEYSRDLALHRPSPASLGKLLNNGEDYEHGISPTIWSDTVLAKNITRVTTTELNHVL